ncbi:hypothetical protein [Desulfogranum japonicum]|uniref:hypothetical protein n=1 Tax=Desulfogranum japonicum TaxID=231447 RepID=UPI00048D9C0B|nr:hypothetical protein [Desulfogranum japonicum]
MKKPHYILIYLSILFAFLPGCGQEQEPLDAGPYTFKNSRLTVVLPANWFLAKLPGSNIPCVHTTMDYGIIPNLRLENVVKQDRLVTLLANVKNSMQQRYPAYIVSSEIEELEGSDGKLYKVRGRRINGEKIPVVHFHYFLIFADVTYLVTATCAEPVSNQYESVFDNIVVQARQASR